MKATIRILLGLAICLLVYLCVWSVITPIKFEQKRDLREPAVIANLVDIRTVAVEFRQQHGRYTDSIDSGSLRSTIIDINGNKVEDGCIA